MKVRLDTLCLYNKVIGLLYYWIRTHEPQGGGMKVGHDFGKYLSIVEYW